MTEVKDGRYFRTKLVNDPNVGDLVAKLDELCKVLHGDALDPMTVVWPDDDVSIVSGSANADGEDSGVAAHIETFEGKLAISGPDAVPLHGELVEALEALLKIEGVTDGLGDTLSTAAQSASEAIIGVITDIQSFNDGLKLGDRLEAFKALDTERNEPNFGEWNEGTPEASDPFGYFPAIEAIVGGDATALLAPIKAIAEGAETASAYAILTAYGTAVAAKLVHSVNEGLN